VFDVQTRKKAHIIGTKLEEAMISESNEETPSLKTKSLGEVLDITLSNNGDIYVHILKEGIKKISFQKKFDFSSEMKIEDILVTKGKIRKKTSPFTFLEFKLKANRYLSFNVSSDNYLSYKLRDESQVLDLSTKEIIYSIKYNWSNFPLKTI